MISTRYGILVSVLLGLALVPTVIHNYVEATTSDGMAAESISGTLGEFHSKPTARRDAWVKETYASGDWIERLYQASGGESVRLFVARSYDLKKLYHHPEIGVLRGFDVVNGGVGRLPELDRAPVHLLRSRTGRGLGAYALLYEGELVANPVILQLQTAWKLLFSARKPMTLFLVYDENSPRDAVHFDTLPAGQILQKAIVSFLSQNART